MRNILFFIVVFSLIGLLLSYLIQSQNKAGGSLPSPSHISSTVSTSKPSQQLSCSKNQLNIAFSPGGAAGSIYADITVTNSSEKECTIQLGNSISITSQATNIGEQYVEAVTKTLYVFKPSEKLYSRVRIPNGPQCQSGVTQKMVTFQYKSDDLTIPYQTFPVQACTSNSEETIINIWPLSITPLTP